MNDFAVFNAVLQQLLAFVERDAAQIQAIEVEQIERVVNDGHALSPLQAALARMEPGALLHQAERWTALFIERNDLSVKDGTLGFYELRQPTQFGKLPGEVILTSRH